MNNLPKLLSYNDHPNIIIYNCNNIYNIINLINPKKGKKLHYNSIEYVINTNYTFFNISLINKTNIKNFKIYLNDIINKKNINNNCNQYVIFDNIHTNMKIQSYLFSLTERNTYKFIFFCNNSKIYNKLSSMCLNIRYKIKIKNINIISNNILDNYLCEKINYKKIKNLSFILSCLNIPFKNILHSLVYEILNKFEITKNKKYECIKFISDIEHKYVFSYNKLIYYEHLLLNIYNIIFDLKFI